MALIRTEDLLTPEQKERRWRDSELLRTDYIVPLTDHPQRDQVLLYRSSLRSWPSSEDFPNIRPTLLASTV